MLKKFNIFKKLIFESAEAELVQALLFLLTVLEGRNSFSD